DQPGEAVFVPSSTGAGYLLLFVYRAETATSDLVILDAGDVTAPPLACRGRPPPPPPPGGGGPRLFAATAR
uniref:carotenoid oxygenase family protein n=1 Tax=Nocardia carnea TaxID=37328 RepID=UPI0024588D37